MFGATLPPEEDLQTYKRSLFLNINASGSRINGWQIATPNLKILLRRKLG